MKVGSGWKVSAIWQWQFGSGRFDPNPYLQPNPYSQTPTAKPLQPNPCSQTPTAKPLQPEPHVK